MLIEDFPLGDEYDPPSSNVLIMLPPEYPQIPPGPSTTYGIYLTGNLSRKGAPLQCGKDQYHWKCLHNPSSMREKGWAWWCFAKFDNWDPQRDDMMSIALVLTETLHNPEKQNF